MSPETDCTELAHPARPDARNFLEHRVRQETEAAITASSMGATLIHVVLATAYARQLGQRTGQSEMRSWVDQHRLW